MLKLKEMSKLKVSVSLLLAVLMVVSMLVIGYSPPEREEVRMGAWVDEIVGREVAGGVAVPMLKAEKIHIFTGAIGDPEVFAGIKAHPEMGYEKVYGIFYELTFNPAGTPEAPVFRDGRLNPFAIPRIREAMNWLIDRDYITAEIFGGMAFPRFFPVHPAFPDYSRYIDVARRLELYYAHDPEKATAIIIAEMEKLGAERIDGIWHWEIDGIMRPVEIIVLSRVEDARKYLGHYLVRLMEDLGFTVKHLIKTAAAASPLWLTGHPYDGLMHIYTGAWLFPVILRDEAGVFDLFFTPRGFPFPLWVYTKPSPEFDELSKRLFLRDFACLEERAEMFERALELAMEDSHRIWLMNLVGAVPRRYDVVLAADLAGGIAGSWIWGKTVRFEDPVTREPLVGGTIKLGSPAMLVDPWNPIDGSNWLWDWQFKRPTMDVGTIPDPFTGLWHPQRIERAEVYVREGLPVGITHDWLTLEFVPQAMEVPADAWVRWDAIAQRFITLAEAAAKEGWDPTRATADVRVRIHYPADMFDTVKWHDGSPLDLADFVMDMILTFDRAKEESPIFDPAAVPAFTVFMGHFRGVRIVSKDPLVIESFTNMVVLDAEVIAADWTWFPTYARGQAGWHNLVPAILAEKVEELAFGSARAGVLGVEWTSFIAGPSIPILKRHLADAKAEGFIPFAPTLGQFITPAEAAARYAALTAWVAEKGHFWVALGVFYLEAVYPVEEIVHLRRFPHFSDPAERWVGFVAPRIAEVEVIGPLAVRAGTEAVFDIEVTFRGEPYPVADVDFVTYLLVDARGDIVYVGIAVAVEDGLWRVVLPAEKTARLAFGSTRLEIAVAPIVVAIPSFDAATFVLLP